MLAASTKLPRHLNLHYPILAVVDGGRSLALIDGYERRGSRSVWVLEGLGSWSKRYTIVMKIIPKRYPYGCWNTYLYLGKNGEVLFNWVEKYSEMVTSYNLETREEKILSRGDQLIGYKAWSYIESLVLLNKIADA